MSHFPSHWDRGRIKWDTVTVAGATPSTEDDGFWLEGDDPSGTPFVAIADMSRRERVSATAKSLSSEGFKSRRMPIGQPGTLLFAMYASVGEVAFLDISATWNQALLGITPDPDKVDSRFLRYVLLDMRDDLLRDVRSNTQSNLNAGQVGDVWFQRPPLPEQRAIADYLDRETARIDTLIEEQQRLIEMLRERRRATISSVVARGLDDSVSLKESGLPGAGPVPEHWEVMPLRYTITFQEGPGIMAVDFRDEGIPLLRISCVRESQATLAGCNYLDPEDVAKRWSHFRVDLGDLLISASASMGTVSEVTEETVGAVPYTGIIRIKPGRMVKEFIRWFVVSGEFIDQVDSSKTGSTIQHFGPTHLSQMRVALPPAQEQQRIATYLNKEIMKVDTLIAESERFIDLALERRSALITAAVTGQIDVREAA